MAVQKTARGGVISAPVARTWSARPSMAPAYPVRIGGFRACTRSSAFAGCTSEPTFSTRGSMPIRRRYVIAPARSGLSHDADIDLAVARAAAVGLVHPPPSGGVVGLLHFRAEEATGHPGRAGRRHAHESLAIHRQERIEAVPCDHLSVEQRQALQIFQLELRRVGEARLTKDRAVVRRDSAARASTCRRRVRRSSSSSSVEEPLVVRQRGPSSSADW